MALPPPPPGAAGAEEGHGARVRHENPAQGRHAGEGADRARAGRAGYPGGGGPPVGGEDVLQLPGPHQPVPGDGVPAWG